jgi:FMN phosphatase YigB (HAD superfamily)
MDSIIDFIFDFCLQKGGFARYSGGSNSGIENIKIGEFAFMKRLVLCDVDHTLLDTDRFWHVDFRGDLVRLGVDLAKWDTSYGEVWKTGYSLESHVRTYFGLYFGSGDRDAIERLIRDKYSDLSRYLFPDVLEMLNSWKSRGATLAVLSFGSPKWQNFKLYASGIYSIFNTIHITATDGGGKAGVVKRRAGDFDHVVVIDNDPRELDAIQFDAPTVQTVWINRVPSPEILSTLPPMSFHEAKKYVAMTPHGKHFTCTRLGDIVFA